MFRSLREKIERALERRESSRPLTRDDIDRLLHGMREEIIDMRARLPKLQKEAEKLSSRAEGAIRRAELAHGAAREAESAGRTDEAHQSLEAARAALREVEDSRTQAEEVRAEAEQLKADALDKMAQLKDAERNRSALLARARRAGTARKLDDMLRGPESGARRFERAEEDIDAEEDMAAATRELEEELGERPEAKQIEADMELRRLDAARAADEIDQRLAELKRQMEDE